MASNCQSCGKVSEKIFTCDFCGSAVCRECLREFGCDICKGRKTF